MAATSGTAPAVSASPPLAEQEFVAVESMPVQEKPFEAGRPEPPPLREQEVKKLFNWLGFLPPLLIGLIAAFLLLFLISQMPGCSGTPPGLSTEREQLETPPSAPSGESAPLLLTPQQELALGDEKQREAQLRARLDQLRYELMLRAAKCTENTPQEPQTPRTPPEPPWNTEKPPMSDLLPQTQDPAEVKPEIEIKPELEVKPEEKPDKRPERIEEPVQKPEEKSVEEPKAETEHKPEAGDPLAIPPDAAENKDLSFLKGCWVSTTDLYNFDSKEPITVQYCFDENGKGTRTVREKDGSRCAGPLQARFDSSEKLVIDGSSAACNNGGRFVPQRVQCSGQGNSTQCYGKELSEKGLEWKANFRRQ
jgi:hypothetical protein